MEGYGHSDPFRDVDFARKAGVRNMIITHHDIKSQDEYLNGLERRVREYAGNDVEVVFAREGYTATI
ncbi:MAG: hypothetical protein WCK90_04215 [archaeon]